MHRLSHIVRTRLANSSGVTLIELMVSLVLFSIGILAITAMTMLSITSNSLTNKMTQANLLAQDKMEYFLSFPQMSSPAFAPPDPLPPDLNSTCRTTDTSDPSFPWPCCETTLIDGSGAAGGIYDRCWEVSDVTNDSRWITVTVGWTDSNGTHDVELKTRTRGR